MQAPLYFRTKKSTRIRQGKPQTPTKVPIVIEESPKQYDKMTALIKTQEEGYLAQNSPKYLITYVRRPITRSTSSKGKNILQDTQQDI